MGQPSHPVANNRHEAMTSPTDNDFKTFSAKKTFFFPGQGVQYVGMGAECVKASRNAKELFEKASAILGYDLFQLCLNGPKARLDKTEVCQVATLVHSMAAIERLREEKGEEEAASATVCLGLSLGEYSALCYAGAISFEDCVSLTKVRGEAMQKAAEANPGGMVSVLGLNVEQMRLMVEKIEALSGEKLCIANYLSEGNYVVSGGNKACRMVENMAKSQFNARIAVPLVVAGAFHTEFMSSASEPLNRVLKDVCIVKPRIPVISNVDGCTHSDPEVIRSLLMKQVWSPVLLEESLKSILANGYESGYELGPGTIMRGILTRTDATKAKTITCIA